MDAKSESRDEFDRIRRTVADMIYAKVGWTNSSEMASNDITHFIIEDRRRILERVREPLNKSLFRYRDQTSEMLKTQLMNCIDEALSIIDSIGEGK